MRRPFVKLEKVRPATKREMNESSAFPKFVISPIVFTALASPSRFR